MLEKIIIIGFSLLLVTSCSGAFSAETQDVLPTQIIGSETAPLADELPLKTATQNIFLETETPEPTHTPTIDPEPPFTFAITSDMTSRVGPGKFDDPVYFRGACEAIANSGSTAFMVSVGDVFPPADTQWTVDQTLGEDYPWYPVVGNHDVYPEPMEWLRNYDIEQNGIQPPNIVNTGPPDCEETTYSFDHSNAHFVILNVYCDTHNDVRTDGAIVDALYNWLEADLAQTEKDHIFVFGHEPAFPQPDEENGLVRHLGESLDKYPVTRDRFWNLLQERGVVAYITGYTHAYSIVKIDGVWQVDAAHAMGNREQSALSTFILIHVDGEVVSYETYRAGRDEGYTLRYSGLLD